LLHRVRFSRVAISASPNRTRTIQA
jgi:hypothetical protein